MIPAVLDHLWQSTIVVLGVALLMPVFKKASAAVRYGLWFAASLKFLVPFAALAALGRLLAPAVASPVGAAPAAVLIGKAARPFSQVSLPQQFPASQTGLLWTPLPATPSVQVPTHVAPHLDLGLILLAAWAAGCIAVLVRWVVRSGRVRAALRSATPLAWPAPMPVLASPFLLEPGLVGLWRPVLVVPETLPDHLGPAEIDAILAHEACHLRRRDNLSAAAHMLVEALFWFHPLVWWIGARLIEERERACDEAVVGAGHDRSAYARSLLESARLYLESPLSCVAGASGSNLKTRVEAIMTAPASSPLSRTKKALLLAAGVCTFATPVAAGLLTTSQARTAVAHAVAVATGAPVPAAAARSAGPASAPVVDQVSSADERAVATPIALAENDAVRSLDVAGPSDARAALVQGVRAPSADPGPSEAIPPTIATPSQTPSARPRLSILADPVTVIGRQTTAKTQAANFVHAYSGAKHYWDLVASWANAICVTVAGLPPEQDAAVKARVEEVARSAGVTVLPGLCGPSHVPFNIEIFFTPDPQRVLDGVARSRPWLLNVNNLLPYQITGARAVTRPIQAWYATTCAPDVGWPAGHGQRSGQRLGVPCAKINFVNAMVVVDQKQTAGKSLGALSDYAAMLALSQPASLDTCNDLPSVTDLFVKACAGRGDPDGLTVTDAAFLKALYEDMGRTAPAPSEIADRMVDILRADKVASR